MLLARQWGVCLLGGQSRPFVSRADITPRPNGTQKPIPEREEWLREICLDAPTLMMHVMVSSIVACEVLQRVPGQGVPAMIIDGLERGTCEEPHALAWGELCDKICKSSAKGVEQEAFKRVVIKSTIGVGHVEPVMPGVKFGYNYISVSVEDGFAVRRNAYCKATCSCAWPDARSTARCRQP